MEIIVMVYIARSGSTLLARLLGESTDEIVALPENRLLETMAVNGWLGDAPPRCHPADVIKQLKLDPQFDNLAFNLTDENALSEILSGPSPVPVPEAIARVFAERQHQSKATHILFKQGANLTIAEKILAVRPKTKFIHIFRDGRAVLSSMLKARSPYFTDENLTRGNELTAAIWWKNYLHQVSVLRRAYPQNFYEVKYETFVTTPSRTIAEINSWLGLCSSKKQPELLSIADCVYGDKEMELHKKVYQSPDVSRIFAWQNALSTKNIATFEKFAGNALRDRGYPVEDPKSLKERIRQYAYVMRSAFEAPWHVAKVVLNRLLRVLRNPRFFLLKLRLLYLRRF